MLKRKIIYISRGVQLVSGINGNVIHLSLMQGAEEADNMERLKELAESKLKKS